MNLISLQLKTTNNFENNLNNLVSLINQCEDDSFILAPELVLSGFYYDKFEDAYDISLRAIDILKTLSLEKTIALTLLIKKDNKYFNTFHIFNKGEISYTQSKVHLFPLDDELKYFTSAKKEDIKIFEINNIKVAVLICFELRFIELWEKVKGADIILVPAMWGKARKQNYISLTNALAIMNQCYVIASNSSNSDMASSSAIINPFGEEIRDDKSVIIKYEFDKKDVKKMRRYLNIGINKRINYKK